MRKATQITVTVIGVTCRTRYGQRPIEQFQAMLDTARRVGDCPIS